MPLWTRYSKAGSSVRATHSSLEHAPHTFADDDESNFFVPTKRLKGKNYREAADVAESRKKETIEAKPKKAAKPAVKKEPPAKSSTIKKPAVSPRTGLAVEVVIPVRKASSRAAPIEISDSEEESDAPKPRRRRIARKASIPSDDDDNVSEEEVKPKGKRGAKKAPAKRSAKAKKTEDSDYEDQSAGESESDAGSVAESSDDDDVPKKAVKRKPQAKAPKRKSKGNSSDATTPPVTDDSEAMSVDESSTASSKTQTKPKTKATSNKRKAAAEDDDGRPAKKQKRREDTDPWKLRSPAVRRDWTQMRAPPLEMFHFARKVVDEYTYLDGKIHSMVTNVTAARHWVLSGTPPIHDFGALKTISAFLNLHLGVDDDGEGQSTQVKKRKREQTGECVCGYGLRVFSDVLAAVEKFHSFREVHSLEWHAHRHELGQSFLDRFVRQVSPRLSGAWIATERNSRTSPRSTRSPRRWR